MDTGGSANGGISTAGWFISWKIHENPTNMVRKAPCGLCPTSAPLLDPLIFEHQKNSAEPHTSSGQSTILFGAGFSIGSPKKVLVHVLDFPASCGGNRPGYRYAYSRKMSRQDSITSAFYPYCPGVLGGSSHGS